MKGILNIATRSLAANTKTSHIGYCLIKRHYHTFTMAAQAKARILIVGAGGVGAMAAYALETGGMAEVTAVMRSNYAAVEKHGIDIDSIEHGHDIKGWRPTASE